MILMTLLIILALLSCSTTMERISIKVGEETFTVEVARTPEEREKGLMDRKSLGEREGMLFVFEQDRRLSFWMKNTYIPLSIAYIAKDGTIRDIFDMEPLSQRPIESTRSVRYALELNQGAYAEAGVEVGDKIIFPEDFR
jgi:uncharacterized membrane protein (UPF0127 family)